MYITTCEIDCQSRFNACDRALRASALGWPWGMGWGGRWEGSSGWGTHVHPWLIHVYVWQKPLQYCKVISLQLKKKKSRSMEVFVYILTSYVLTVIQSSVKCSRGRSGDRGHESGCRIPCPALSQLADGAWSLGPASAWVRLGAEEQVRANRRASLLEALHCRMVGTKPQDRCNTEVCAVFIPAFTRQAAPNRTGSWETVAQCWASIRNINVSVMADRVNKGKGLLCV